MPSYNIPNSPITTYITASGGQVVNLNGVGYGELLNSQTGEVLAINSMTIQPYSSPTFTFNKQISQLLEPFVFNKRLAWGESRVFVLNPTVDINQESPTLKNISLEKRTNEFIFDGTTRLTYRLLPFATINVQFNYTKLTNFVFGRPELIKYVVEQNEKRNQIEDYLNNIAKEYTLVIYNNK